MSNDEQVKAHLARRNALFRSLDADEALKYWYSMTSQPPLNADVPLAMVHKARLQWLDVTDEMITESLAWLREHDFYPDLKGAPPLTPERRDADRASLGMPPLNK